MNATTSPERKIGIGTCRVVDRGPNWLFVRFDRRSPAGDRQQQDLAAQLLEISEQHFVYRIVLEMEQVESIDREALEGLDTLRERLAKHGGALRFCGLRDGVARAINDALRGEPCNHATRHGAVVGDPDEQPPRDRAAVGVGGQLK